MLTPIDSQLGLYTTTFMTIMLGIGKLVQIWKSAKSESVQERRQSDDAMWTRRDQMIDDLRAELADVRTDRDRWITKCRDIEDECGKLRRQRDDCWTELDKLKWPKIGGKPKPGDRS